MTISRVVSLGLCDELALLVEGLLDESHILFHFLLVV